MGASVSTVLVPVTTPGRPLPLREACVHLCVCPGCALLRKAQPVGRSCRPLGEAASGTAQWTLSRGCPQRKVSLTVTAQ